MSCSYLDSQELLRATFVSHVELHDRLASTNDRARELARDENIGLPTLIAARVQTAGRGRGKNRWWAADGALTFSLLLGPHGPLPPQREWPRLSLATAVALRDSIAREVPHCQVVTKWPNDVLINGRKVAGILIESPGGPPPACERLIVGIGINVNNSWTKAEETLGDQGIAICDMSGKKHSLQRLLIHLLQRFEHHVVPLERF